MKDVRTAVVVAGGVILLVIAAAAVLTPLLPWLFALFVLTSILRIATRDSH